MRLAIRRSAGCIIAALMLLHGINCLCVNALPPAAQTSNRRACCATKRTSLPRPAKDAPDCPHCHPAVALVAVDRPNVPPPDLSTGFVVLGDGGQPAGGIRCIALVSPENNPPPPIATTLLSLHCALTT